MTAQQAKETSQGESVQEVDRIRDIIFGSQMRDYEQRFQTLVRDLDRLQKEIDRLATRLTSEWQSNERSVKIRYNLFREGSKQRWGK